MTAGDSGAVFISLFPQEPRQFYVFVMSFQCTLCICALSVFEFSLKVGNLGRFAANKSMNLPTRVSGAQVIKMQTVAAMLKVNRQTQNRWEEPQHRAERTE